MPWIPLNFGKHINKTLPQVVWSDPDWFFWAYEEGVLNRPPALQHQADDVYRRATSIRIPQTGTEELVAEYAACLSLGGPLGKYAGVQVVPKSQPAHNGYTRTFRLPVFNLAVPRIIHPYDKSGGRQLVKSLKPYLFGDPERRLTRQVCEEFFENDDNFVL
jgi:hypothetical protein